MEPSHDREDLARVISGWNRETLIDEYVRHRDDFEPGAQEILEQELARRGLSEEDLSEARQAYRWELAKRALADEKLVTVQRFSDRMTALVAQDLLEQAGIPCFVRGLDRLFSDLLALSFQPITIKVAEHDVPRAQEALHDLQLDEA
ncbi:MAG: DUF2007 domain-containing protein [Acidobacteriota bacterium]